MQKRLVELINENKYVEYTQILSIFCCAKLDCIDDPNDNLDPFLEINIRMLENELKNKLAATMSQRTQKALVFTLHIELFQTIAMSNQIRLKEVLDHKDYDQKCIAMTIPQAATYLLFQ